MNSPVNKTISLLIMLSVNFSVPCSFANETGEVTASQLTERNKEIEKLKQKIEEIRKQASKGPKQKYISSGSLSNKPPVYRDYVQGWVKKIEQFAELNYPPAALELKKPARMNVKVAIKADGSVHDIRVSNFPGNKQLEQDVISLVKMAAPFAPFPDVIKQETDILHIVRTWHFIPKPQIGNKITLQEKVQDK